MALLSIILPVYNVEAFLRQSLDSIFRQKNNCQCEVIIVNDGSTDNSLSIAREYEKRYNNLKVIDKANEGVSATRNKGLDEAKGDYVFFMDADDLLHPQALDIILPRLKQASPDILTWKFDAFYTHPKFSKTISESIIAELELSFQDAFNSLMQSGYAVSLCAKAIRRSLISNGICLDTTMTYGEDMFFSWKCFLLSKHIDYIDAPLYYYRQTGNSAVSRFHPQLFEKYSSAFDDIENFANERGLMSENLAKDINYHFACRLPALVNMELKAPYSKKQKIERLLNIISSNRISSALNSDERLTGSIYNLARAKNVEKMLYDARSAYIKSKILFPLKKILK